MIQPRTWDGVRDRVSRLGDDWDGARDQGSRSGHSGQFRGGRVPSDFWGIRDRDLDRCPGPGIPVRGCPGLGSGTGAPGRCPGPGIPIGR